jgi:hypothetical protein
MSNCLLRLSLLFLTVTLAGVTVCDADLHRFRVPVAGSTEWDRELPGKLRYSPSGQPVHRLQRCTESCSS